MSHKVSEIKKNQDTTNEATVCQFACTHSPIHKFLFPRVSSAPVIFAEVAHGSCKWPVVLSSEWVHDKGLTLNPWSDSQPMETFGLKRNVFRP